MPNPPLQRRLRLRRGASAALLCAALLFAGATAPTTPALAQALQVAQANNGISLAEATRMVSERTGGQVLRAETKRDKGRAVHRIRVLTEDGRVRTWHVDAETGRIY
jgi:uncharacterized membrane protein YkoI